MKLDNLNFGSGAGNNPIIILSLFSLSRSSRAVLRIRFLEIYCDDYDNDYYDDDFFEINNSSICRRIY